MSREKRKVIECDDDVDCRRKDITFTSHIPNTERYYIIDLLSYGLIVITFVYLTWIMTTYLASDDYIENLLASRALVATVMAMVGLSLKQFINNAKKDTYPISTPIHGFDEDTVNETLKWVAFGTISISLGNVVILQSFTTPVFDITGTEIMMFYIAMAVVEEVMFCFLFQIVFEQLFETPIAGIISRSFFFMLYHLAVYSSEPLFLLSTLWGGFIFAFSLYKSRRLSTVLIIHILINFMGSIGTIQF